MLGAQFVLCFRGAQHSNFLLFQKREDFLLFTLASEKLRRCVEGPRAALLSSRPSSTPRDSLPIHIMSFARLALAALLSSAEAYAVVGPMRSATPPQRAALSDVRMDIERTYIM